PLLADSARSAASRLASVFILFRLPPRETKVLPSCYLRRRVCSFPTSPNGATIQELAWAARSPALAGLSVCIRRLPLCLSAGERLLRSGRSATCQRWCNCDGLSADSSCKRNPESRAFGPHGMAAGYWIRSAWHSSHQAWDLAPGVELGLPSHTVRGYWLRTAFCRLGRPQRLDVVWICVHRRPVRDLLACARGGLCGRLVHAQLSLGQFCAHSEPYQSPRIHGRRGRRPSRRLLPQLSTGVRPPENSQQVFHGVRPLPALSC